nr:hypothetical protein BN993_00802 [Virgibacillus halodenitrificans]
MREPECHMRDQPIQMREPACHMRQHAPNMRERPIHMRQHAPNMRERPIHMREHPTQMRENAPYMRQHPIHMRDLTTQPNKKRTPATLEFFLPNNISAITLLCNNINLLIETLVAIEVLAPIGVA